MEPYLDTGELDGALACSQLCESLGYQAAANMTVRRQMNGGCCATVMKGLRHQSGLFKDVLWKP